ncbi:YeeE/YedE family protein [Leucothrix sargassi]|nr:YeeE/YedE family protein [Leucothrix sargassi]
MSNFIYPILGGVLIGLSATLLLLALGRIAGISGIVWAAITDKGQRTWRWFFLGGLVLGSVLFHWVSGVPIPETSDNWLLAAVAGLIVGVGVKLGSGCTSGHGVCGIGRLSMRSLTATITFMLTAIITVAIVNAIT